MCTIFLAGFDLNRKDAFLFLFYYAAYVIYLVLEATGSEYLGWIEKGFFFGVLPFTLYYMFSRLINWPS
jgi:ABC-type arginine transport system permease subunit